ncbi:MAG: cupredoxin domain-containing protein [Nanoarchaeota archaeon]
MKNKFVMAAIIILGLVIVGFLLFKPDFSAGNVIAQPDVKEFTVNAFQFGYSPNVIEVNKGDNVRIIINNTDTLHGMRIPNLSLRGNEIIEFTADKQGEFTWYCTNMCGQGHMQMQGKLIVR